MPTNGNNVFIVFTGNNSSGNTATFTNAPSNVFVADSLSITNMSTGLSGGTLSVTFSGMAYFTSGVAQVNFAGGGRQCHQHETDVLEQRDVWCDEFHWQHRRQQ